MREHDLVHGLAEVLPQMPAIRDLDSLWGSFSGSRRVVAATVPADDLDLGMGGQPPLQSLCIPVGQHVDRPVGVHVDHNG
jgi:hypothetical protein